MHRSGAVRPAGAVAYFVRDGGLHPPNLLPAAQNEIPASGYFVLCSLKYSAERS